jgi:chromosomal replication initiator protein
VTDGIATLSLDANASSARAASACAPEAKGTLDEFVLGPENALLKHGVGLNVTPGAAPSLHIEITPLTLFAPPGLGKSQLLQALAATWTRQRRPDSVIFLDAADFARAYATAVKLDDVPRFQQRFQRSDLLLIDNLDSLQSKTGAQQQLASIVEHRQRHQRPTVLTARQSLRLLGLTARLTSRLASGLVIRLQLPTGPTRQVILRRLCERRRIELTPEAERLLSEQGRVTVPQLMGILNQLKDRVGRDRPVDHSMSCDKSPGESSLRETRIDVERIQHWLQTHGGEPFDVKAIIRATARYFGLPQRNLSGSSRRKMDVLARSFAMYLTRELTGLSFQQIGQFFGGRDHTTVIHAYKKVSRQQTSEATAGHALREIRERLHEKSSAGTDRLSLQQTIQVPVPPNP